MHSTRQPVKEITVEATVIRCTCGTPAAHAGAVCPAGRAQALGLIGYYHVNPLRRLAYRVRRFLRK